MSYTFSELSIFGNRTIKQIKEDIQNTYLMDNRPWLMAFSGGKDSTATLQLLWYSLQELPKEKLTKNVYILNSDTMVESPIISQYTDGLIEIIKNASKKQGLPFIIEKLYPNIDNTFWVNLLGKGYPAPTSKFRWCTHRLKIEPMDRYVFEKVSQFGEIIIVLGVRKSESAARANVMRERKIQNSNLSRHTTYPFAYVYTPIEDFSIDDVWNYLLNAQSPWSYDNQKLLELYKDASKKEELLLIHDTKDTPAWGNSRFGCWICTVVPRDKSLEGTILSGQEWMRPLLDFRNDLVKNRNLYREEKGRDGRIRIKNKGVSDSNQKEIVPGPYELTYLKELLKNLLEIQKEIQTKHPEFEAITIEELKRIRILWKTEKSDFEDSLPKIYESVYNKKINWEIDDLIGEFSLEDSEVLHDICQTHNINPRLIMKLLEVERQYFGMKRRAMIYSKISKVFNEEWRTKEEVLQDHE